MKNKLFILTIISIVIFSLNFSVVNAASEGADSVNDDKTVFDRLKSEYQKNSSALTTFTVTNTEIITLNGYSKCNGSSCTVQYMGISSDFKDALARVVKCSNGENYINYQIAGPGGGVDYMEDNKAKLNGEAYWTSEYSVTCTSSSTGATAVQLSSDSKTSSSSNSSSSSTTTASSTTTTSSGYSSATTTDNQKTGVSTYFMVLGFVAVISYIFMICVKKYNLFKNI